MKKASLNHVYRLVWSALHSAWVAVAEIAKGHSTASASQTTSVQEDTVAQATTDQVAAKLSLKAQFGIALALALSGGAQIAHALPTGAEVQFGDTTISTNGPNMDINQSSQKAIVNWQTFNIANNEAVRLVQPNGGMALYRVVGNDASQIYGQLSATGQLFLINPNGVLFAPGSKVDVGSIVASTLNITNGDFLNSQYKFSATGNAS